MASPTSAAAVANAFLDIQAADTSQFPAIDQMKIQKLVYYSHAWFLAYNNGSPLFDEDVYAWPWGPVIPPIYGEFRGFGRESIDGRRATLLVRSGNSPLDFHIQTPPPPPQDIMKFLRRVWESHKGFTGVQLSNATHAEGEPWWIVKQQYGTLDSKPLIPNNLIHDVFRAKLPGNPAVANG
jgi:uncharacterized phage-associated protein